MSYSPMTEFLKDLKNRLSSLDMPVKFELPGPEELEPFIVIGTHTDDDSRSAKHGLAVINTDLQIDIFYPKRSRTEAEEVLTKAKACLGRRREVTSSIRIDDSIGRKVYHIIIRISDIIL